MNSLSVLKNEVESYHFEQFKKSAELISFAFQQTLWPDIFDMTAVFKIGDKIKTFKYLVKFAGDGGFDKITSLDEVKK
ncbi:hypothetical protein [Sigmofec virus UA08Rod_6800]|uniref:Uncharacterized protein n=1 Tax=Sigmofec virus UA08Rod_6800 TaxID=2929240 RepID=A0A976R762_9VIRU|nr:hypothetical protein [Sigmofec virus UA08Rod_6800]